MKKTKLKIIVKMRKIDNFKYNYDFDCLGNTLVTSKVLTFISFISLATLTQWPTYGEWAYECNSPPIRNAHKVIARHS